MRRPLSLRASLVPLLCALWGAWACDSSSSPEPSSNATPAPAATSPSRPLNLVLISLDSTRRDMLSCYGRTPLHAPKLPTTPNIDRLASEGVLMEDAYAESSWTLVSHMSMLTGQSSVVHGVDKSSQSYSGATPLLAEALKAEGYATAGFFSGPFLAPRFGFDRGFDRYEERYGDGLGEASRKVANLSKRLERTGRPDARVELEEKLLGARRSLVEASYRDVSSQNVTDGALDELRQRAAEDKPFFLFVHYFDPHYDYAPPSGHDLFDPGYEGSINGENFLHSRAIAGPKRGIGARQRNVSERDLERIFALYEGEMHWTDAEVGRILDELQRLELDDDTLVIVTADHGDEFFEHGSIGHRRTLFEEVTQIPMILRLPGRLPAGRRAQGLVCLADVAVTALELLGLKPFGGASGRSFAGLARGDDAGASERAVTSRVVLYYALPGANGEGVAMVDVVETFREGAIKVTRRWTWPRAQGRHTAGQEELVWIDVERYPDEPFDQQSRDFSDPRAKAALLAFRESYAEHLRLRSVRTDEDAGTAEIDEGMQAMLEGLGYTGDEESEEPAESDPFVLPLPGEALLGR